MTTDQEATVEPSAEADYYRQAGSWAHDRQDALASSRRVAWIMASMFGAIAFLEAIAIIVLTPLKTVVPYTLLVDRHTGFVQALKPLDAETISADRSLTQSFLVQYVIAREAYDRDTIQLDYRKVGLWSAGRARSDYLSAMQATNPDSPLVRYPAGAIVDVAVKSVSALGPNLAQVRFDTRRRDIASVQPPESWIATIRYSYSGEPMSAADRFINPLGFQVLRYRRSAEVLPTPTVTTQQPVGMPIAGAPLTGDRLYRAQIPSNLPLGDPTRPPDRQP